MLCCREMSQPGAGISGPDISKGSTGVSFPSSLPPFFFRVAGCNDGVAFRDQRGALSVLEGRHRGVPFQSGPE